MEASVIGKCICSLFFQCFLLQATLFSWLCSFHLADLIMGKKRSADSEIWYIELVIGSFYHAVRRTYRVITTWSPEVFYTKR